MNTQIIICFLLLAFDIVMFMTEKIKPATTAAGGTATLIGTVGNTTIAEMIKNITGKSVGFFEFMKIGGPMLAAGAVIFYFWGEKILPEQEVPQDYLVQQTDYSTVPRWKQWTSLCVLVAVVLCIILDVGYDLYLIAATGGIFYHY